MTFSSRIILLCSALLLSRDSEGLLMKKMMKGAMGSMMMYHPPDDHYMMPAPMPMMMPAWNPPMDANTMSMMMMMMGMPAMPMNDEMRAALSMEQSLSLMSRMMNRAQSAHEAADTKMKHHLRSHEQRSDVVRAPCKHQATAPQAVEPLAAPQNRGQSETPCRHALTSSAPAAMHNQPLTQMGSNANPNGGMSASLVQAPQMMAVPMMQYPMRAPTMSPPMMPMMASGAFPPNVVAMDSMGRQS
ncbi:uncharacterized protein LOC114828227 [Galendromus occidentalis]|uniref:Uncharacterized protein LOC114828227 n=1 Tax=Galendromus occidentalis TaxID=34638 RepID=A0AAJ7SEP9_9ACAR|nr:uncharacterized protein LOC114828227 [Galendromus occidentalis]